MTLVLFQTYGYDVIIDVDTNVGRVYTSIESMAKYVDQSTDVIESYVNEYLKGQLGVADILTNDGVKKMEILNDYQILDVIRAYNPEIIECLAMTGGIRQAFYELAGFDLKPISIQAHINPTYLANIQDSLPPQDDASYYPYN